MASPAKLTELLPDTLPEDFGEWDDEGSSPKQPVRLAGSENGRGLGVVPRPAPLPAESPAATTSPRNLLRGAAPPTVATELVEAADFVHRGHALSPAFDRLYETVLRRLAGAPVIEKIRFSAPRPNGTTVAAAQKTASVSQSSAISDADEVLLNFLRTRTAEPKPAQKKPPIIAGIGAALVVVLAAAIIPVLIHKAAASGKSASPANHAAAALQKPDNAALKPTLSTPAAQTPTRPQAPASDAQNSSGATPESDRANAGPSPAQAQMMNDQLDEPTQIHKAAASAEQAPPPSTGFAAADLGESGNNNAIGGVFSNANMPRVQAAPPKFVTVSSGATLGLLIRRTQPVYPPMAKTARISGTVVLAATISRTGTIKSLQVVSGPPMLRGSAVDAVRTWRYRPYMLDNQPTEFETTINVNFTLDN